MQVVLSEWSLVCYDKQFKITCHSSERIVIHSAFFGYFHQTVDDTGHENACSTDLPHECWIEVTASISQLCSGNQECKTNVHYSVEFSHDAISLKCLVDDSSPVKPSLFVEYTCVSKTLFTKISHHSHVDSEQVGGYLSSLDYTEALAGGTEWRSQLADVVCKKGVERLPIRFNLSAPIIQPSAAFGHEESVAFILRIKDFHLTQPSMSLGPRSTNERQLRWASDLECPGPGRPCHLDYLEISAKLTTDSVHSQSGSPVLLPVTRLCLTGDLNQFDMRSGHVNANAVGRTFGPLPMASALQFKSNLNLLEPHVLPGKGILIEYIALFCTPISAPSGYGIVDYRFRPQLDSSRTIAYAELFCPSDRWFEPQKLTDESKLSVNETVTPWWLERQRHTKRICDHHSRSWLPEKVPEACLTESELEAFVAKMRLEHEQIPSSVTPAVPNVTTSTIESSTSPTRSSPPNDSSLAVVPQMSVPSLSLERRNSADKSHVDLSIAIGVILGLLVCVLLASLIVYSLRQRFNNRYEKTPSYPSIADRMTRSSSTFNPSIQSFHPSNANSADMYRKWQRSKWDVFKPWRGPSWSQNLRGTYPDLPRQTLLHGSSGAVSRTPETVLLDRPSPLWPPQMYRNGVSSFSLVPGYPNPADLENNTAASVSPWLRTNSTTRLGTRAHFFASSATDLIGPLENSPQLPRTWWIPWRRNSRRHRRQYNQMQRRKQAYHYQSQRRLMEPGAISKSSSIHFGLSPSTPIGVPTAVMPKVDANGFRSGQLSQPVHSLKQHPRSGETTHSSRTLVTLNDVARSNGSDNPVEMAFNISYPASNDNPAHYAYSNVDPTTGYALTSQYSIPTHEVPPETGLLTTTNEQLPWKIAPPTNSLSEGFRRISSFLRNLNESMTPPRSVRRTVNRSDERRRLKSLSALHSLNYSHQNPHEMTGIPAASGTTLTPLSEYETGCHTKPQRSKSETGSLRFVRNGLLRSLFNLPAAKEDPSHSVYNFICDDTSTLGDPMSGSVTTRTSRIGSTAGAAMTVAGADYWSHYPDLSTTVSEACTICPQSQNAHRNVPRLRNSRAVGQVDGTFDRVPVPCQTNDPYLVPSSLKRLRHEAIQPKRNVHSFESDALPSGTSSAISSLVFADSVDDDQEELAHMDEAPPPPVPSTKPSTPLTASPLLAGRSDASKSPFNHGMDYFTYDQAQSVGNTLATDSVRNVTLSLIPPGELLSTQVAMGMTTGMDAFGAHNQIRRRNSGKEDEHKSRPLSDAMISNHYYDGNDLDINYPHDPKHEVLPPMLPPRINPPSPHGFPPPKCHPPLPPLWTPRVGSITTPDSTFFGTMTRDIEGSTESLYETVDNIKPVPSEQQPLSQQSAVITPFGPVIISQLERQKLALPPTPGSIESLHAPVASSDDATDEEVCEHA